VAVLFALRARFWSLREVMGGCAAVLCHFVAVVCRFATVFSAYGRILPPRSGKKPWPKATQNLSAAEQNRGEAAH